MAGRLAAVAFCTVVRFCPVGGTPVMRVYNKSACCAGDGAACADAPGDPSRENIARAHSAPAAGARACRAPSSLNGVLMSIALVYSQHDYDARGPDYTEP